MSMSLPERVRYFMNRLKAKMEKPLLAARRWRIEKAHDKSSSSISLSGMAISSSEAFPDARQEENTRALQCVNRAMLSHGFNVVDPQEDMPVVDTKETYAHVGLIEQGGDVQRKFTMPSGPVTLDIRPSGAGAGPRVEVFTSDLIALDKDLPDILVEAERLAGMVERNRGAADL